MKWLVALILSSYILLLVLPAPISADDDIPIITDIVHPEVNLGETLDIQIFGTNLLGVTSVNFDDEVTVNSFAVNSDTHISTNITIAAVITTYITECTVTTSDDITSEPYYFYKGDHPSINSIFPTTANQGETLDVNIRGDGFTGVKSVNFGIGVTVSSFAVINDSLITACITIDDDALVTSRNIRLTDLEGNLAGSCAFYVSAPPLPPPSFGSRYWPLIVGLVGGLGILIGVPFWVIKSGRKEKAIQLSISLISILRRRLSLGVIPILIGIFVIISTSLVNSWSDGGWSGGGAARPLGIGHAIWGYTIAGIWIVAGGLIHLGIKHNMSSILKLKGLLLVIPAITIPLLAAFSSISWDVLYLYWTPFLPILSIASLVFMFIGAYWIGVYMLPVKSAKQEPREGINLKSGLTVLFIIIGCVLSFGALISLPGAFNYALPSPVLSFSGDYMVLGLQVYVFIFAHVPLFVGGLLLGWGKAPRARRK